MPFRDACIPVRLGWSSPVQGDLRDQREVRAEQRLLLEEGVDVLDEQGGKYSGDQPERRSVAAGLELARRTIAKYREELKIPTSNQRKVLY